MDTSGSLHLDPAFVVGPVRRRIFGSFVEHMGRCVYTGIYEPGAPNRGRRRFPQGRSGSDPRAGVSVVRYPGRELRLRLSLGGRRRARG